MKDLYTFDISIEEALKTYETVRQAYTAFFNEFKIPYLTAEASSGEIGGDLSHEYHFPSSKGEDNIITCDTCDYVANEELAECESGPALLQGMDSCGWNLDKGLLGNIERNCDVWFGVTKDRSTLLAAVFPRKVRTNSNTGESSRDTSVNPHVLKRILLNIDMSVEDPLAEFKKAPESQRRIFQVYDERLPSAIREIRYLKFPEGDRMVHTPQHYPNEINKMPKEPITDLIKIGDGDTCTKCKTGTLKVQTAVELGHTFHLGTRYSKPLEATVAADPSQMDPKSNTADPSLTPSTSRILIQMGCHGIGVSRLIAAVADSLADSRGLNWPTVMAPFQAVIVPTKNQETEALGVYDLLVNANYRHADREHSPIDTILDDRKRDFGWKLKDADMIGYPVIVVVGRDWKVERKVEVQCRRLGVKEVVAADGLREFVAKLLREL